jgi:hypothetical protein
MAQEVRRRRGTTAEHAVFAGAAGEITVDTDKNTVVVHDGATLGGFPLAHEGGGGSSPLTTKGDIFTHDATVDARLPVGTNTQLLTADSTQATGLKWIGVGSLPDLTAYLKTDGTRALTGDQSAGTHKITNLGTPSVGTDAATKAYVDTGDALAIAKSLLTTKGDIIGTTGASTPVRHGVGADTTVLMADAAQADGIKWAAQSLIVHANLGGLSADDHTQYTKADGTRAFTGDQSMGSHKLTNVTDPASAQDAATMAYADTKIAKSLTTTKGDIIAATAASTPARVGIGTDGQVLMADAASTPGLKWTGVTGLPDNSTYIRTDGTRAFSGNQDMGGNKLTGLAAPSAGTDATTKTYVDNADNALVPKTTFAAKGDLAVGTGVGTLSRLAVGADNTVPMADSTQATGVRWSVLSGVPDGGVYVKVDGSRAFTGAQSMGSNKLTNVTDPTSAQDAATKAYVDLFLKRDGTNAMTAALNAGTQLINNVVDPASAQDAATKNYVDTNFMKLTPTLPTVVSVGSEFHSTGVPTATLPGTHTTNDILILVLQSSNDSQVVAPSGYAQIGPENGIGAAATAGSVKMSVFWKRDGGSETAPTIPDTGDHTYGVMFAVRGCQTVGDPFRFLGVDWKFTASTSAACNPRGVCPSDNSLIVAIFAHAIDAAGAQASAEANTSLSSVTEQFDGSTSDGTGGGIVVVSGTKATAGALSTTTLTWASSTVDVSMLLAFIPVDAPDHFRCADIQIFLGSPADLDDTWTKPSKTLKVHVQVIDGGGGGSGGNTTTTAEGGGGGGGGGYDEAWYNTEDLASTITVHSGKGGAAGTALNQAGNPGVVSEFDKGGQGPLTGARRVAGTAATAAASAVGGSGGCGSGRGTTSPAVTAARIDLTAATAGAALGGVGGRGGTGGASPVGGSPADWGGGGGESGSDIDASTSGANNGWSVRGGGGGGGGRTTTNIGGGAAGGGAAAPAATQGTKGVDSTRIPYGGSGGCGGGSSVVTGGNGGFPGGAGGGGAGVLGGFGGAGGHGCIVVTSYF